MLVRAVKTAAGRLTFSPGDQFEIDGDDLEALLEDRAVVPVEQKPEATEPEGTPQPRRRPKRRSGDRNASQSASKPSEGSTSE